MKSKGVLVKYEQMKSKGVLTFICNKHHLHEVTIICTRYTRSPDKGMHATKKKNKKNPYLPTLYFLAMPPETHHFFFWPNCLVDNKYNL